MNPQSPIMRKALIYCRVSSQRQVEEGHGNEGQEKRCRDRAKEKGYPVAAVFPDEGVSGSLFERPAMKRLIEYLDTHPADDFVIIFDDLSRFARDVRVHLKMKTELVSRGALLECLNFQFDDSPEGEFIETILAGKAQLDRQQNRRQVINRMKARLEMGYWVFDCPPGYKYISHPAHGKLLAGDQPKATIIKEALEGFSTGLLQSQKDVQIFLQNRDFFHKIKGDRVHFEQVKRLLTRVLYTGYLSYPKWKIPLTKGHHEALISMDTFNRIQARLKEKEKVPNRKDINIVFPLRGFILCSYCGNPFTASLSKGRSSKYPYYRCKSKDCILTGKSIRKSDLEGEFEKLLGDAKPKPELLGLAKIVVLDAWNKKMNSVSDSSRHTKSKVADIEKEIGVLLSRIGKAKNENIIGVYEQKIVDLTLTKEKLDHQVAKFAHKTDFETALKEVLEFLQKPLENWRDGSLQKKRTVMKLAFREKLRFDTRNGFGTANYSLPFELFSHSKLNRARLVEMAGVEPAS